MTTQKNRFTVIPAVYLILKKEGKYLFVKRHNTGYMDGYYSLPAGHVDGGESLKAGMVREAKEEINVDIIPADLKLAFVVHTFVENNIERVHFFFECHNYNQSQIQNMEPDKCSELVWLDPVHPNITPHIKTVLMKYEQGENYTDFGF